MTFTLFSYPNCTKCDEVKKYLNEKGIKYEEINAAIGDGKIKFREFYQKNKDEIKREKDEAIILPILLNEREIIQGIEKILENNF